MLDVGMPNLGTKCDVAVRRPREGLNLNWHCEWVCGGGVRNVPFILRTRLSPCSDKRTARTDCEQVPMIMDKI